MELSQNGLELLKRWEGFEPRVYHDSAGFLTIGVGHLLTRSEMTSGKITVGGIVVKYADGLTDNQILGLLAQDVGPAEKAVADRVTVNLTQNQFDALVSFAFNVGIGAFSGSTLLKQLNQKLYNEVPAQLARWTRAGGRVVPGLVNRRNKEIALWRA